jgi:signal transduction histidine kinase
MIILTVPQVLLADYNLMENQRRLLQMADDAGRRMLEMINNSIDMYKMEKGTYKLKPVPVNVMESIKSIRAAFKGLIDEKKVTCKVDSQGNVTDDMSFKVKGEDLLIYTLLANLFKNAVEASPPGGQIAISLDEREFSVISIHNMGAIPRGIRGRYFQKYVTEGKEGGTGLGVYSAKLIATTLGGTIDFTTSEEAGTTFTVRLPR